MASREFADYVIDLLRPLGAVRAKRMFGGFGLYLDDRMFALIADDTLYLKADERNRAIYEARAMPPFTYVRDGKPVSLSYHAVPPEALEDPPDLLALARLGLSAALAAPAPKKRRVPRAT